MNKVVSSAVVVAGLVITMGGAVSWGQVPVGNDTSDNFRNTGGGTGALVSVTPAPPPSLDGSRNTAYGAYTLVFNTTGSHNTAVGYEALLKNQTGRHNTAVGTYALFNNTTDNNTAVGYGALQSNTVGAYNTAIGLQALTFNTGNANTATGFNALITNTTGSFNTADGTQALFHNTTGSNNTACGFLALVDNTTGMNNTALGFEALLNNTTDNNNIAIGTAAGSEHQSGGNNIYIGHFGGKTESGTIRIGQAPLQTRAVIAGIATTAVVGNPVFVNVNGLLGLQASSARYKRDIQDMKDRSQGLYQLRPVTFQYKQDPQGQKQYGLIAEEVAKVYPELVVWGAKGEAESVQYHELIPMLLNEVQHQQRQIAELKAQNEHLQAALIQQTAAMAARLERLEAGKVQEVTLATH
jgi:hypothetical protein